MYLSMVDEGLGGEDGDPLDTDDLEKSSGWVWQSSRPTLLFSSLLVHLDSKSVDSISISDNSVAAIRHLLQIFLPRYR